MDPDAPGEATGEEPTIGPLAAVHHAIWVHEQLFPGSTTFSLAHAVEFLGPFDPDVWADAVATIAEAQPAQRTTIRPGPDGRPRQVVAPTADPRMLVRIDAGGRSPDELDALLLEHADRPFDLAAGPLYRGVLVRIDDDRHVFLSQTHHIVSDMWSLGLWLESLTRVYARAMGGDAKAPRGPRRTPIELAVEEADWLTTEDARAELDYWLAKCRTTPGSTLALPGGQPGGDQARYQQVGRTLDPATTGRLLAVAEAGGRTVSDVLLAAVGAVVGRYGATDSVAVGTLRARRGLDNARTMGMFVNEVPLLLRVDADTTVRSLIDRAGQEMDEAGDHDRLPAPVLLAALRSELPTQAAGRALFDVTYGWQSAGGGSGDGSLISSLSIDGPARESVVHGLRVRPRFLPVGSDPTATPAAATPPMTRAGGPPSPAREVRLREHPSRRCHRSASSGPSSTSAST